MAASSLKSQAPASVTSKASRPTVNGDDGSSAEPSKKRKRTKGKASEVDVTEENFEQLWKRHIEGKGKDLSTEVGNGVSADLLGQKKKRRKRGEDAGSGVSTNGTIEGAADEVEKTLQLVEQETKKVKKTKMKGTNPLASSNAHPTANATGPPRSQQSKAPSNTALPPPPIITLVSTLTPLQQAMREKLISSRFRYLNQTLYTNPSSSSFELFKQNPTFFAEYHEGFQRQVNIWPENPIDGFVKWIRERGGTGVHGPKLGSQKSHFKRIKKGKKSAETIPEGPEHEEPDTPGIDPLPRDSRSGLCTIVDLGCGDAQLAQTLSSPVGSSSKGPVLIRSLNLRIHSFDLAAPSPLITVADIRSLPLPDSSVDVAIFCLALMGTNWLEFIEEAWRVLRWKGECWIGEVGSRFVAPKDRAKRVEHSVGKHKQPKPKSKNNKKDPARSGMDEDLVEEEELAAEASQEAPRSSTDVSAFVEVLRTRGFTLVGEPELGNKMFVRMRFRKTLTPTKEKCVPKENDARRGVWHSDGGRDLQRTTQGDGGRTPWNKPARFIDRKTDTEETTVEEEGKLLKPCVYKAR